MVGTRRKIAGVGNWILKRAHQVDQDPRREESSLPVPLSFVAIGDEKGDLMGMMVGLYVTYLQKQYITKLGVCRGHYDSTKPTGISRHRYGMPF
jgi:hypothetical protein